MANDPRPSLTMNIETRYPKQHEGGAFDVRKTLDSEDGTKTIDAASANGQQFQLKNGFLPKPNTMITQLNLNNQSRYVKNLDNRRYKA